MPPAETMGKSMPIAGAVIQLPTDAYVERVIVADDCRDGALCQEAPALVIRRGRSAIVVGENTGRIASETTYPGEEHGFDFIKEHLKRNI